LKGNGNAASDYLKQMQREYEIHRVKQNRNMDKSNIINHNICLCLYFTSNSGRTKKKL